MNAPSKDKKFFLKPCSMYIKKIEFSGDASLYVIYFLMRMCD